MNAAPGITASNPTVRLPQFVKFPVVLRAPALERVAFFSGLACLLWGTVAATRAETPPAANYLAASPQRALASRSGQFHVRAVPGPLPSERVASLENDPKYVRLDPMLLTVSCERIKQMLWRELGLQEPWTGRIYVTVHPPATASDPITIGAERFRDGWQYGVDLPEVVERLQYVRSIVQVVLLEIANRTATDHGAELPAWVTEGFARRLLTSTNSEVKIILPPPQAGAGGMLVASTMVNERRNDPLQQAHEWLCAASPLTFQELSWPTPEQLNGGAGSVYGSSAQFFLSALLELRDGPACLRSMLAELPKHYNWQLAFLRAFHNRFQRPLDVEKWWALQLAHFTGRNLTEHWSPGESWQKLDECVSPSVQVRFSTNSLPLYAEGKLQNIIRDSGHPARQTQALQEKLQELEALKLRLAPDLVAITEEYRQVLLNYLELRDRSGFFGVGKQSWRNYAATEALKQLDALDIRRAKLGSAPVKAVQADNRPVR